MLEWLTGAFDSVGFEKSVRGFQVSGLLFVGLNDFRSVVFIGE